MRMFAFSFILNIFFGIVLSMQRIFHLTTATTTTIMTTPAIIAEYDVPNLSDVISDLFHRLNDFS